jgi:hypothetical protein
MWKYLTTLLVLLAMGGLSVAQPAPACVECYANIITQTDTQTIQDVRLGLSSADDGNVDTVAVGNEGLSAAVIVTPMSVDPVNNSMYSKTGFARIDQTMTQTIKGLGSTDPTAGEGAKGITWNKAIQAAWIVNQGQKEKNLTSGQWEKEGAYIAQTTTQSIQNVYDYDSREKAKVLNVDNKLAMIVDDINRIVNLTASANSKASDDQASYGTIENDVNITIAGKDP